MARVGCGCALVCRKIRRHLPPPFPHTCISISSHSFPLPLPLLHSSASQPHYSSIPRLPSQGAYSGGRLDENGLRALLSRVVFVLTECHRSEDFVPAKRLLTTSLVYHIEGTHHLLSFPLISSHLISSPCSSTFPPLFSSTPSSYYHHHYYYTLLHSSTYDSDLVSDSTSVTRSVYLHILTPSSPPATLLFQ
ncbi:unnamed protein product [Hydatigera taeniaeformis]|uniref:Uncharacterized protein n=1 Tax=Hydatigena taeniaeformis TaxID=6205 RepID=A0A0R3XD96_HYDTA|nr:unnamed protein product [Hydatigera taeniaeformis]